MLVILLTPEHNVPGETAIVNQLFRGGLARLHIRKPSFSHADYQAYVSDIDPEYHDRVVVHGAYDLYPSMNLGGIHLNSHARIHTATWQEITGIPTAAISTSFHSWQEIRENTFSYGYVFISPVFDSISKKGYNAGIELGGAKITKEYLRDSYCPRIVGLGGVTRDNLFILEQHGFDGGAMLGSVWSAY